MQYYTTSNREKIMDSTSIKSDATVVDKLNFTVPFDENKLISFHLNKE
jgi:hypothetical protein